MKRKVELDILKGLAILAVVVIHFIASLSVTAGNQSVIGQLFLVMDQIARFSVPLFVALSGYGLSLKYSTKKLSVRQFFQRRAVKIIPLYLFWSILIYTVVHLVSSWGTFVESYNILEALILGKADYQLYFVPMIFQLYLLYPLLWKLMNHVGGFWVFTATAIVQLVGFSLMNNLGWTDQIQYTLFTAWIGYFTLGMWLARLRWPAFLRRKKVAGVLLGAVMITAIATFLHAKMLIEGSANVIVATRFTRWPVFLFASGSLLLLVITRHWLLRLPQALSQLFSWSGKYSYLIFLSHTMVLRWIFSAAHQDVSVEKLVLSGVLLAGGLWWSPKLATMVG